MRERKKNDSYKFNEVEIGVRKYYGEYTSRKQQLLFSAAQSYGKRHGWEDFLTRKDKSNNKLMLIRLK